MEKRKILEFCVKLALALFIGVENAERVMAIMRILIMKHGH
jgi:hypothetical protein